MDTSLVSVNVHVSMLQELYAINTAFFFLNTLVMNCKVIVLVLGIFNDCLEYV